MPGGGFLNPRIHGGMNSRPMLNAAVHPNQRADGVVFLKQELSCGIDSGVVICLYVV
jgi:hypothetical protein